MPAAQMLTGVSHLRGPDVCQYAEASEESDEEEVTSAPVLKRITPPTGIELALLDLQARMQQQMLVSSPLPLLPDICATSRLQA